MAGRERMHTKRFWRSSESSRETHFHVFSLVPASERVSERLPATLWRILGTAPCSSFAPPSSGEEIATSEQTRSREATSLDGCRAPYHGRLPSIFKSPGRHLGPLRQPL